MNVNKCPDNRPPIRQVIESNAYLSELLDDCETLNQCLIAAEKTLMRIHNIEEATEEVKQLALKGLREIGSPTPK